MTVSRVAAYESAVKQSRFRLTPDAVILGLLAVLGFLWISDSYRWFGLRHFKGWPVLIGVATVFVVALVALFCFSISPRYRSFFRYRIRSLFLMILLAAIPCAWLSNRLQQAQRQQRAVQSVLDAGGSVEYRAGQGPDALRRLLVMISSRRPGPPARSLRRSLRMTSSSGALTPQSEIVTIRQKRLTTIHCCK